jgi:hypothetical protein
MLIGFIHPLLFLACTYSPLVSSFLLHTAVIESASQ